MPLAQLIQGFWGREQATPEAPWRFTAYAVIEPGYETKVGEAWYLPNGLYGLVEQVQSRSSQQASTAVIRMSLPMESYPPFGKEQPPSPLQGLSGQILMSTDKSWMGRLEDAQRSVAQRLKEAAKSVGRIRAGMEDAIGDAAHEVTGRKPKNNGLPWWVYAVGAYLLSES